MRSRNLALLLLLLAVFAVMAGCSDSGSDDASDSGPFVDLLSVVPDSASNRSEIYLGDWAAASEAANEEPPEEAEDVIDFVREINEATDQSFTPNVDWLQSADQSEEFFEQMGFHLGQIDASIVSGEPPELSHAFLGRFDADGIAEALEDDPEWSDLLEVVEYDGTEYFSWDDEPEPAVGEPGPRDRLGRGGNLFVSDDLLLWAFSAEAMEGMIDAREGDAASLADDEQMVEVAEALEDLDAYTATIVETDGRDYGQSLSPGDEPLPTALQPYELLATGAFADGSNTRGVIILVNEDETTAEENVDLLTTVIEDGESIASGEPWSEQIEIVSIEADGVLTIATLEVDPTPQLLIRAIFTLDSLFASSND